MLPISILIDVVVRGTIYYRFVLLASLHDTGFYPQVNYNNDPLAPQQLGYITQFNKYFHIDLHNPYRLVGSVKILQLRASNHSCTVSNSNFANSIPFCFSDSLKEDTETYGTGAG